MADIPASRVPVLGQSASSRTTLFAVLSVLCGSLVLSVNDMAMKHLSTDYALYQVILIRAGIGIASILLIILFSGTGFRQLVTIRGRAHLLRVCFVLVSNVTYFLGLAALPLADAVAIAFISPLLVTAMSVIVLGEKVGPRRWAAVATGLVGVLVMLRPGSGAIQPAALLVLVSAFCYASTHMMTRRMKDTESAFTLNFYVQIGFITLSIIMGLAVGDGRFAGSDNPSLAFLFRDWHWPAWKDIPYFLAVGVSVSVGGLLVSQAYRMREAALIAPFEYASMPMAIFWGVVVFHRWPDLTAWVGIALICGAGLYTLWRETRARRERDG